MAQKKTDDEEIDAPFPEVPYMPMEMNSALSGNVPVDRPPLINPSLLMQQPAPIGLPPNRELVDAQQALAQFDRPRRPSLAQTMGTIGRGINPMNPAQFQQIEQQRLGQEWAERQTRRKQLVDQVADIRNRERQGTQDAMAQAEESRRAEAFPVEQRQRTAQAGTAELGLKRAETAMMQPQTENYPPGTLIITKDPSGKELSREQVPFKEAAPTEPNTPFEVWRQQNPDKPVEEWQKLGRAAPPSEPLESVMGEGGKPVLMPRSQAAGMTPGSTRDQGRQVMSSDANRIADLDTSLNDLKTLRTEIGGMGATGTAAKVGAMLPNVVTEVTGWGMDAKKKQATIDRVKQVIGKALEGGVLRKEDEYKYEKILPTIADTPQVVKSKLDGLDKAIQQRRETTLDSLEDANYDVSRYRARGQTPGTGGAGQGKEQQNKRTGEYRHSLDGGKTWRPGRLPRQ